MRNFFTKTLHLLYLYNLKRDKDLAYQRSILYLIFILFLNLLTLSMILNINLPQLPDTKWKKYLIIGGCFIIPTLLLIRLVLKKQDVVNIKMTDNEIKKGNKYLLFYVIATFILITIVVFSKMDWNHDGI